MTRLSTLLPKVALAHSLSWIFKDLISVSNAWREFPSLLNPRQGVCKCTLQEKDGELRRFKQIDTSAFSKLAISAVQVGLREQGLGEEHRA